LRQTVFLAGLCWLSFSVQAQESEWAKLNREATALYQQGRYSESLIPATKSVDAAEREFGPNSSNYALSLLSAATLHANLGQYAEAERLFKRTLDTVEEVNGQSHHTVATTLNNLAGLYFTQGRYNQAEPLFYRALDIFNKSSGPERYGVASTIQSLGQIYLIQKRYALAEGLFRRALEILEKSKGPDHPDVAAALMGLADLRRDQSFYDQAEPLLRRALAIDEKALGADHPVVAHGLEKLGLVLDELGDHMQAEPLLVRSMAILQKSLPPNHPVVASHLKNLAYRSVVVQRQFGPALSLAREASSIYRQRIVAGGIGDSAAGEARKNRDGFDLHLSLLSLNPDDEAVDKIADESFQVMQIKQSSGTASAIAKMAARFATGDDALAGMVKRKQDMGDRVAKMETQLIAAASRLPTRRNAAEELRLREDIARAGKEIETLDADLIRRFPDYQQLIRPEPASVAQIRALLKPGEAVLAYSLGDENGSYLWVARPNGVAFMGLNVASKDVATKVAAIRSEMEIDSAGNSERVNIDVLHDLYLRLFAPAVPHLTGVRHVMVVPSGSLQSLPFGMLVASPAPVISTDADYRHVDWLVKRYAISVLPSVSSIQALRQFTRTRGSQEPFAGIGDPLIGGAGRGARGQRAKLDIAAVFRNVAARTDSPASAAAPEVADVEAVRNAPRLPETADELRAMAKALNSDQKSLWLRENATEAKIKHLALSKYRTIAFATHGVMAGELKGVGEPGLILTPPPHGSVEDDGYLAASEIAGLQLNADWVVLSACNTAAADGTPGAEGLSGLAKAFFYAGARSLLVSHWPIVSDATVPLTTGMLKEYQVNPGQGKAEAHRKAMLALMNTPEHPEYAHPIFWAPFAVVGEGG
jgi:CHAT domain-containing protein/tetratricopeptide (TPR) repeat protein